MYGVNTIVLFFFSTVRPADDQRVKRSGKWSCYSPTLNILEKILFNIKMLNSIRTEFQKYIF